jgi:hypothetical protein
MKKWRSRTCTQASISNWTAQRVFPTAFLVLEGGDPEDRTPLQRPLLRRRDAVRPSREVPPERIRRREHYIEVQLKKEDESPIMLCECEIVLNNDDVMRRRTNENGVLRIDGLTPRAGPFKIRIIG